MENLLTGTVEFVQNLLQWIWRGGFSRILGTTAVIIIFCYIASFLKKNTYVLIYDNRTRRLQLKKSRVQIDSSVNLHKTFLKTEEQYEKYDEKDRQMSQSAVKDYAKPFSAPHTGDSIYSKMTADEPRDFRVAGSFGTYRDDLIKEVNAYNKELNSLKTLRQKPLIGIFYLGRELYLLELDWEEIPGRITQKPVIKEKR